MRSVVIARGLIATGAAAVMTACAVSSQVDSLKPVAGDAMTGLSIAANDVLLSQGVNIKVVPVCSFDGNSYACEGSTIKGEPIEVTARGASPDDMVVSVAGKEIYDGSIDTVLTKAGQR